MIVLDENIDEPQRRRLEMWRIRVRQIGVEVGRLGMKDLNEIIPLLHGLRRSTFFTLIETSMNPASPTTTIVWSISTSNLRRLHNSFAPFCDVRDFAHTRIVSEK